jgi:hypothetical protein
MIPPFDKDGDLPPGIHQATWLEFQSRFCIFAHSDRRLKFCEAIEQLVIASHTSGIIERLIIAGSFVTAKQEPNDYDAALIFQASVDVTKLPPFQLDLVDGARSRLRFRGDIFPVRSGTDRANKLLSDFQRTRLGKAVGVVEVFLT